MPNPAIERIYLWYADVHDGQHIQETTVLIQHLADELFSSYEPMQGPNPTFWQRLNGWLNEDLPEERQKTLLTLLPYIFYVGPNEFTSLYRVAFHNSIARWLIEALRLDLTDPDAEVKLRTAVQRTWFCPITDSMRINAFHHVNNIAGHDLRPDWRTLAALRDEAHVLNLMSGQYDRIVLLEDFVGSGSQIEPALRFVADFKNKIPTLIVPLVVCPDGATFCNSYATRYPHIHFSPVLKLDSSSFLTETVSPGEHPINSDFRSVAIETYGRVTHGLSAEDLGKLYGPFGFAGTGCLVVLWTNCPDNTLPLIHQNSEQWTALFPRASRL